jgi:hypothetical protein
MVEEALTELEALLSEERDAIVRLDGGRVLALAARKQELVTELAGHRSDFSPPAAARLRALTPALRHNGILLAHARDVIRDGIAAARAGGATLVPAVTRGPAKTERPSLSVRG